MARSGADPPPRQDSAAEQKIAGVTRNVFLLGLTSFFADISGEMVYPLVPIFLTAVLGAPVATVGLIEGAAESTASIVKIFSGWWSDRAGRRVPLVIAGYGLAALGKLLLALASVWSLVLVARFVDRFGKGLRGSPRDALIAESSPPDRRGRAFGFHRSLDTAGAVIGPLLGLLLVAFLHNRLRLVFAIAAVPGALGVLVLLGVHEPRRSRPARSATRPAFSLRRLDRRLQLFLLVSLVFALGNSSDAFLILRAKNLGLSTTAAVLAYVVYNFVYMGASLPAGIISDRRGRRAVFVAGLLVFALAYTGFALADRGYQVWPLFAVYGLYIALTDGVGKALITDVAPDNQRGMALGAYGMITGSAALLASLLAGVLWDEVGVAAPFALGAAAALAGAVIFLALDTRPLPGQTEDR